MSMTFAIIFVAPLFPFGSSRAVFCRCVVCLRTNKLLEWRCQNVWANLRRAMCNFGFMQHISLSTLTACRLSAAIHCVSAMRIFLTSIIYKSRAHARERKRGQRGRKNFREKLKTNDKQEWVKSLCFIFASSTLLSTCSHLLPLQGQ